MRDLLKAAAKTGGGSLASLLLGATAMKVMAVMLGPVGVGLFSILRQAQQTATVAATCGGQTALIQGLASRKANERGPYLITVIRFFIGGTFFTASVLIFLAPDWALLLFDRSDPGAVSLVRWLVVAVVFGGLLVLFGGVLNGHRALGRMALSNAAAAFILAMLAYPASLWFREGYEISLVALLVASLAGGALLAGFFAAKADWLLPMATLYRGIHAAETRHFLRFAGTTFAAALIGTGTILAVRAMIAHRMGIADAGVFDVAWTLSMMYVMLVLTSFGTYYLPTLSGMVDRSERLHLIQTIFRFSILAVVPLITAVIAFKPLVIHLLYSEQFLPSLSIMRWMLIGDYFKVFGWVLAMPMLAFADMKMYLLSELCWHGGFLALVTFSLFGLDQMEGIGVGFAIMYFVYFLFSMYYLRQAHGLTLPRAVLLRWAAGLGFILGVSYLFWESEWIDWPIALTAVSSAGLFSLLALEKNDRKYVFSMFLNLFRMLK